MNRLIIISSTLLAAACAAVAPNALVKARADYDTAQQGPAGRHTPADLYEAKKQLDKANAEFETNGDTYLTRDYAYVASRKVEIANAKARIETDRQQMSSLAAEATQLRDQQYESKKNELNLTQKQLEEQRQATALNAQEAAAKAEALEAERAARAAAEDKLAGAMKDLATVAAVKEDRRGVVITLSGSVLFASGKSQLLNTAQTKLDQVATTLKDEADGQRITVEGHTDSVGSDVYNEQLSLARATAVRDYLVSRGVKAERIEAKGLGETKPLVDNSSSENRANNRRVEIVIHREEVPVG
ncbi:MAG: OmpA family protein [Myxococcaceae bacterium]|nr:OmpA family protein [Myxococcaceae bacterium]